MEKSHAIDNFRIAAGLKTGEFYGMVGQDSDVAKWLEGVAYSLMVRPNTALEERADEIISIIEKAQQPDGYLDTYFIVKKNYLTTLQKGYVYIKRKWARGDQVAIRFPMEARRVYANQRVRENANCVALLRGLIVYCFESVDNGDLIQSLRIPREAQSSTVRNLR